ncbi:MAG: hypothetical protein WCQ99_11665 [Pseudomonadota bacterium]
MAKCAFCSSCKGKRNCPALAKLVCSQCCGSERQKKIDCPSDCFYLGKSTQYFTEKQEVRKVTDFEREMNSIIGNENEYRDVLQNIEFAIYNVCKEDDYYTDRDVQTALAYLFEMGKAQLDMPAKFLTEPSAQVQIIIDAVDSIIKLRDKVGAREDTLSRMKCIYRILDSVKTHYDSQDDRSYIEFIGQFLP